jgi:hypothetical protein
MAKKKSGKISNKYEECVGTPTAIMLPIQNYKYKEFTDQIAITMPRRGNLKEMAPNYPIEQDADFDFLQYDEEQKKYVISLTTISQVLFATAQYPELKKSQAFVPGLLIIGEDDVVVIGKLIEMVQGE